MTFLRSSNCLCGVSNIETDSGSFYSGRRKRKSATLGILFCWYVVNLFLKPMLFGNNSLLRNPCDSSVKAESIEIFPIKSGL